MWTIWFSGPISVWKKPVSSEYFFRHVVGLAEPLLDLGDAAGLDAIAPDLVDHLALLGIWGLQGTTVGYRRAKEC